jgi:anti-anti-sigma factor
MRITNPSVSVIDFAAVVAEPARWQDIQGARPGRGRHAERLVLALDDVRYLDRAALGMLLRLTKRFKAGGGEISLSSLPKSVRLQAQKMRLHHILDIFNTPEEALRTYLA